MQNWDLEVEIKNGLPYWSEGTNKHVKLKHTQLSNVTN